MTQFKPYASVVPTGTDPYEELFGKAGGPGNIFREFLRRRTPQGASGLYRDYAEGLGGTYENVFRQMRGLGEIQSRSGLGTTPKLNYDDWLQAQGTGRDIKNQPVWDPGQGDFGMVGAIDPLHLRGLATRAGGLISGPEAAGGEAQIGYREKLIRQPNEQFALALQSVIPGLPNELRGWFEQVAQRAFDRWMVERAGGGTDDVAAGEEFLPRFIRKGYSFF